MVGDQSTETPRSIMTVDEALNKLLAAVERFQCADAWRESYRREILIRLTWIRDNWHNILPAGV